MILKKLLLFFIITFSIFGCVLEDDNSGSFTEMSNTDVYNFIFSSKYLRFDKIVSLEKGITMKAPFYYEDFDTKAYVYFNSYLGKTYYIKEDDMSVAYYLNDNNNNESESEEDNTYSKLFKGSKGTYKQENYSKDTDELLEQFFFSEVTDNNKIELFNNAIPLPEASPTSIGESEFSIKAINTLRVNIK